MIRLEPLNEAEFQEFIKRAIPRYASRKVQRGLWTEEAAIETSKTDLARFLAQGKDTPDHHLCNLRDETTGTLVGESWYTASKKGGKVQFWIEWIWVEPQHRRKGYATQALQRLEEEARSLGADRLGLNVWMDNPGAIALYSSLGYQTVNMAMAKSLGRTP
ncbi:MAG: GNAT family N-acetyltransferase [Thermoplasmata archaeon]|jgi:ribosomal protein S18 acetylase RimI-like enzyme